MSAFKDAIDCLRAFKNDCKTDRLDAAIAVLEAAGKIDRAYALIQLDYLEDVAEAVEDANIRALLSSLPDEGGK